MEKLNQFKNFIKVAMYAILSILSAFFIIYTLYYSYHYYDTTFSDVSQLTDVVENYRDTGIIDIGKYKYDISFKDNSIVFKNKTYQSEVLLDNNKQILDIHYKLIKKPNFYIYANIIIFSTIILKCIINLKNLTNKENYNLNDEDKNLT